MAKKIPMKFKVNLLSKQLYYLVILIFLLFLIGLMSYFASLQIDFALRFLPTLLGLLITFLFFIVFFEVREKLEWKEVADNGFFEISLEMVSIFSEIIELVEDQLSAITFKMTVNDTEDANTRKTLIFSKIREYNDAKSFKLAVDRLDPFTSQVFYQARTNLYSIHVIYGNLIDDARIVNDIIKVRNMLRLLELMQKSIASFIKMINENQNLIPMVQKLSPELKQFDINSLPKIALPPVIKSLVEVINDLWEHGVQFDRV